MERYGTINNTKINQNVNISDSNDLHFELDLLARAYNYQRWVFDTIEPFLGNRILELGAGIGNMSKWLPIREKLILTEYDLEFLKLLKKSMILVGLGIFTIVM